MDLNGLSADQAPPISVPFRFFLTAPLFGILAGILILSSDVITLSNRFSMESIAITHAITIGFLGFVMLGALTQMLPVLAGVKVPKVGIVSKISYPFLFLGTIFMIIGLMKNYSILTLISSVLLGVGFLVLTISMLIGLSKVTNVTASVRAIITSLFFSIFIVLMGVYLLFSHGINIFSSLHVVIANVHSVWAVFGFAGLLIIGVAFHVLPMFYVAPRFKHFCKTKVTLIVSVGLVLWLLLNLLADSYSIIAKIWIAVFFWAFATTVWKKLNERRRPIVDVTIWYWRSSAVFMTLGAFAWALNDLYDSVYIVVVSILIGGFILSIMMGMLYKIIPFLVWFHLNARGYMSTPTITEMIDKRLAKIQFVFFIVSMVGFIVSFFIPTFLPLFASTFIVSMLILEYNIISPVLIYARIIKTKPDFDMSLFSIPIEGNQ
ncbi:hypothetical protein HUE87_02310 [Candidatus Sulfurimonas marisnigri]|uniref:Uncharacterized protein n=1 Tax=Candidatus Sulfurimonas marisnigri TaxID=2740405 RepID=A0A7S7RR34_9BACT|nr:hypothetical protein [Candidatus Sulfurimonas marisnigri]QOY55095.1 hypothetical protein HUE87_02310 [Candidatus Sulfurimonas marisnigri]